MFKPSKRSFLSVSAIVAAASGSVAHAQWTVTVLEPGSSNLFARANAVHGTRQGGSRDNGYSVPRQWTGSAASGLTLAEPGPDSGSAVNAITATNAFGDGYVRTSDTDGYYAALLWNASGSSVTIFPPPIGYYEVEGNGAGGNQQVGALRGDNGTVPALWTGTPQSLVNLLPAGSSGAVAQATDGVQQVGYANFEDTSVAALWSGTAASFVNLHPAGTPDEWIYSDAMGVSEGRQVGYVGSETQGHAAAWQGTAASFVDLHPAGAVYSYAQAISKQHICGTISVSGPDWPIDKAAYWSSPARSAYVDLHAALPSHYEASEALGIWTDGAGTVRIVGSAYNTLTGNSDAIMWTNEPVIGACCNGVTCTITLSQDCSGSHQGASTTCGPLACCGAPIGGSNAAQDCDGDLMIDACFLPAADCNNNGDDLCETLQFTSENFSTGPGAFVFNGAAGLQSAAAALTPSLPGQVGSIVRPPLTTGTTQRLRAIFDFRVSELSSPVADGFSFSLMDANLYTTNAAFGETGLIGPGVITVMFNTFENVPGEGSNSMFIRHNGVNVAQNVNLPFTIADARWHRAIVELSSDGMLTVKLATNPGDLATVFNSVQLPGYVPFRANIGFGGRTGGSYSKQEVANIRLGASGGNDSNGNGTPDTCECPADFNHSGLLSVQDIFDYLATYFAGGPGADFNASGVVSVQDIFDFLAAFFAGCD